MLPPTLLDRQREIGIQQVEIDARPARLLQCWIQLFHVAIIGGIPSQAKPDFAHSILWFLGDNACGVVRPR